GWVVDRTGRPAHDPQSILQDLSNRTGGGILPLGGEGEQFGGHKGYGLAVMVDILCSVLSGAPFGPAVADTKTSSARVSHFLGAIKIDTFRNPHDFRLDMDHMLNNLRNSQPADGSERIYYAGLKEFDEEEKSKRKGIVLLEKTYHQICDIGARYGIPAPGLVVS
ncbi:MAG: Ldh family oxidoreductase, partial [Anaerolineales bacterium]|nr:Ldh family oxidoreductase [Anaerolineales bacterium]